jgi:hypothetical protein
MANILSATAASRNAEFVPPAGKRKTLSTSENDVGLSDDRVEPLGSRKSSDTITRGSGKPRESLKEDWSRKKLFASLMLATTVVLPLTLLAIYYVEKAASNAAFREQMGPMMNMLNSVGYPNSTSQQQH